MLCSLVVSLLVWTEWWHGIVDVVGGHGKSSENGATFVLGSTNVTTWSVCCHRYISYPPKQLPFPWACPTLCKYMINNNWVIVRLLYIIYTFVYCFVCYMMCTKTSHNWFKPILQQFSKISKRVEPLTELTVLVDHFFRKMDWTEAWTAVQSSLVFSPMDWTLKHY